MSAPNRLLRRAYERALPLLPMSAQITARRALLWRRRWARARASGAPGGWRARPLAQPPGDPRRGATLVVALGGGRPMLARACADAADRQAAGEPVVVISDVDGVDLARDAGVLLELVPPRRVWCATTGRSLEGYARFVRQRLGDVADAWGVVRVHQVDAAVGAAASPAVARPRR